MIRALHLTRDLAPKGTGGLSTAVAGLIEALRSVGIESAAASFDRWRPQAQPRDQRPPIVEDGVLRLEHTGHLSALGGFIAEARPDVICVHDAMLWGYAEAAAPRIYVAHVAQAAMSRLRGLDGQTLSDAAEARALAEADAIFAPSRAAADALSGDAQVLPLGVPISDAPLTAAPDDAVLYVGRLGDIKGTDRLLAIMLGLLQRRPDLRCLIAGGLPAHQKAERRWRRRWAELAGPLAGKLTWLGWQSHEDLQRRYDDASVVLIPSRFETFGQVPLEAAARGRPVICTDAGALPDQVRHDLTGLVIGGDDPAPAMIDATLRLLDDPQRRADMGRTARAHAEGRRWAAVAPRWAEAIHNTLSRPQGRA